MGSISWYFVRHIWSGSYKVIRWDTFGSKTISWDFVGVSGRGLIRVFVGRISLTFADGSS